MRSASPPSAGRRAYRPPSHLRSKLSELPGALLDSAPILIGAAHLVDDPLGELGGPSGCILGIHPDRPGVQACVHADDHTHRCSRSSLDRGFGGEVLHRCHTPATDVRVLAQTRYELAESSRWRCSWSRRPVQLHSPTRRPSSCPLCRCAHSVAPPPQTQEPLYHSSQAVTEIARDGPVGQQPSLIVPVSAGTGPRP